jgi:hypothetical protein
MGENALHVGPGAEDLDLPMPCSSLLACDGGYQGPAAAAPSMRSESPTHCVARHVTTAPPLCSAEAIVGLV